MVHPFEPIINNLCKVIVLGSVPSIKSIEAGFAYGNKQNRFWKIMSEYCGQDLIMCDSIQKKVILLKNNIAMYDAVKECDIYGSQDSAVFNVIATDIDQLILGTNIEKVLCNGALAYKIVTNNNVLQNVSCIKMPSTSPANATINYEQLCQTWLNCLKG